MVVLRSDIVDIKEQLKRINKDNERILKENYELAQEILRLKKKLDEHMKTCGVLTH